MEQYSVNKNQTKSMEKETLLDLDKEDLVSRILRLEAHNKQLKNIIAKKCDPDYEKGLPKKNRPFNFDKTQTRGILLRLSYFGWNYQGLTVQEDTCETIEHHLFKALTRTCLIESREGSNYHRCGRTDKGVSSFGQIISIRLRSKFPRETQNLPESIDNELPYCKMLNRLLPDDIKVLAWLPVPVDRDTYSARFDCTQRIYKYYLPRGNLNIEAIRLACRHLVGSHDFRNLCKMDVGNGVTEYVRRITAAEVVRLDGADCSDDDGYVMYFIQIQGNAFLWHQIRCIVGILLLIGQGYEEPDIIRELLNVEKCPRKPQYSMAADFPLNLFKCEYGLSKEVGWKWDLEELQIIINALQGNWTRETVKSAMYKDALAELSAQYECLLFEEDKQSGKQRTHGPQLNMQAECLLQGVKPKIYKRLLERDVCSSLDERIEHYKKKKRIQVIDMEKSLPNGDNTGFLKEHLTEPELPNTIIKM